MGKKEIERLAELFPEWEKIINNMFLMAQIHGVSYSTNQGKILKEFSELLKKIGVRK